MISIDNNGKISTLTEKSYGENILFAAINDFVFVVSEGSLGILDPSGKELSSEKVSDASIDYLKAVVTGKNSLLVYHNREAAVGIRSAASDKALNEVKTDCDAFDCIVYKNNLILISSSGKTITSETIEPEKAEKPD
ncbi:hypothetical protein SDC9_83522 [bioreactor metagenome]|uniref:Uncharacterized protein n=1 Tax=bioreactor metagenome TaxID=1076179 RepID=A0A644Z9G1_9ZZZZ